MGLDEDVKIVGQGWVRRGGNNGGVETEKYGTGMDLAGVEESSTLSGTRLRSTAPASVIGSER